MKKKALSVLAKYYFFRIYSLIYGASDDYSKGMEYSLKAFDFLSENASPYRDDLLHYMNCKNNYLDNSIILKNSELFNQVYPELLLLVKNAMTANSRDVYFKAFSFQILCSLRLRFLWLIKDASSFLNEFEEFYKSFNEHAYLLWPSFKAEILLSFAKLKFLSGDLDAANEFCNQILDEKRSPSNINITCGNLLRLMINFDRNKHQLMPHLISTTTYALKKRDRLFELERTFINGLKKIKPYHSNNEKKEMFRELQMEIKEQLNLSEDLVVDDNIRILEWLENKTQELEKE